MLKYHKNYQQFGVSMGKIISFFNHKGGVGKTTLVHNLGFILADRGYKVLLIDADPQMNLTAAMYGLSTSVEYSTDEDSKWNENIKKYISLSEHLNIELREIECNKTFFRIPSDKNE
ncbi:MAG: ParA family protein, partial [Methylococcales bacterium]|nr:ParA family protein [Methylococcales bacterium]